MNECQPCFSMFFFFKAKIKSADKRKAVILAVITKPD